MANDRKTAPSDCYAPLGNVEIRSARPVPALYPGPSAAALTQGIMRCTLKDPLLRQLPDMITVNLKILRELCQAIMYRCPPYQGHRHNGSSEEDVKDTSYILELITAFQATAVLLIQEEIDKSEKNVQIPKPGCPGKTVSHDPYGYGSYANGYFKQMVSIARLKDRLTHYMEVRTEELQNPDLIDANHHFRMGVKESCVIADNGMGYNMIQWEKYSDNLKKFIKMKIKEYYHVSPAGVRSFPAVEPTEKEIDYLGSYKYLKEQKHWILMPFSKAPILPAYGDHKSIGGKMAGFFRQKLAKSGTETKKPTLSQYPQEKM